MISEKNKPGSNSAHLPISGTWPHQIRPGLFYT